MEKITAEQLLLGCNGISSEETQKVVDRLYGGSVDEQLFGTRVNIGDKYTVGTVEGDLGVYLPSMRVVLPSYKKPKWIPSGRIGPFSWAEGGPVDPMSIMAGGGPMDPMAMMASGGYMDPMIVGLLTELVDAVREGKDTEVNVFTDLRGESRAAVTDFRSEMRERDLRGLRTA